MTDSRGSSRRGTRARNTAAPLRRTATRAAILDTFASDPHARESASDLVRAAGVSRSAFYQHFADVDDVARCVVEKTFARISAEDVARRARAEDSGLTIGRASIAALLEHVAAHRELYARLLTSAGGSPGAHRALFEGLSRHVRRLVHLLRPSESDAETAVLADMIAGATLNAVQRFVADPDGAEIAAFSDLLIRGLPEWLQGPVPSDDAG